VDYVLRFYRDWVKTDDLITFEVKLHETDLAIRATANLTHEAMRLVRRVRTDIELYAESHQGFIESLVPLPYDSTAPDVVREMLTASTRYGVGPMAAVAGAVASEVGRGLLEFTPEVIVENGGDVFLRMDRPARLMLYSGEQSPFGGKLLLEVDAPGEERGICTSSATIGHSLSMGHTDAVLTIAEGAPLADAAATAIGNRISSAEDVSIVLDEEKSRGLLLGAVITIGETLGAFGEVKLLEI
jgi:ApbE superfamily uncharacterized protein (UPF0280 family)